MQPEVRCVENAMAVFGKSCFQLGAVTAMDDQPDIDTLLREKAKVVIGKDGLAAEFYRNVIGYDTDPHAALLPFAGVEVGQVCSNLCSNQALRKTA